MEEFKRLADGIPLWMVKWESIRIIDVWGIDLWVQGINAFMATKLLLQSHFIVKQLPVPFIGFCDLFVT